MMRAFPLATVACNFPCATSRPPGRTATSPIPTPRAWSSPRMTPYRGPPSAAPVASWAAAAAWTSGFKESAMAVDATMPTPVVSTNTATNSTNGTSSSTTPTIANNFQTFLTLLTTQLQNQNPLDPLDTNQFTAQLVQFAGVEQQLRQNDQLAALINIEKSTQSTQALAYVGNTVAVDGSKAQFDTSANWSLKTPQDTNATITITSSTGQTAFTG